MAYAVLPLAGVRVTIGVCLGALAVALAILPLAGVRVAIDERVGALTVELVVLPLAGVLVAIRVLLSKNGIQQAFFVRFSSSYPLADLVPVRAGSLAVALVVGWVWTALPSPSYQCNDLLICWPPVK